MTDLEFAEIMSLGHELTGVEFKASGPLNARKSPGIFVAQVVKAMLGMANRRDGGTIVVGVEDKSGTLNPVGVNDGDLKTWVYDRLADQIANYADPSMSFDIEIQEYDGNQYVVVLVHEFDDVPVLCKRSYSQQGQQVLRDGACYVRARRKPETTEIPTQADMRDLLDLAIDKGVRRYLERAQRLGIITLPGEPLQPQSEELFNQQIGELL